MSKLSDELNEFSASVRKLPSTDRDKLYAAIRKSFGPVTAVRLTKSQERVETRTVDMTMIDDAVPADLRIDWREIKRSLNDSIKRHGNAWGDESVAYILSKFILPKPTPAELMATDDLVDAIAKKLVSRLPAPRVNIDDVADAVARQLPKQPTLDELAAAVAKKLQPQAPTS